jgi:hypothetical protein
MHRESVGNGRSNMQVARMALACRVMKNLGGRYCKMGVSVNCTTFSGFWLFRLVKTSYWYNTRGNASGDHRFVTLVPCSIRA